jgi:hypothetical protein
VRQAAFHAQGQRRYPQPSEEVSDVDGSLSSGRSLSRPEFQPLSEPIDGLLRKRGSAEDRPFVGFQDVKPGGDIRCMVRSRLERDAKIGTEECSADFRDEFFASVSVIGEALTEVAIAAMRG